MFTFPTTVLPGIDGSTHTANARQAAADIAVRRGALLLATDGSDDAVLARRAVADLASSTGAVVHVVGAWDLGATGGFYPGAVTDGVVEQLEEGMRSVVEAEGQALRDTGIANPVAHVRYGRPAEAVLGAAEELGVDLTVLGSRGRGGVARLLLGSVSEAVVTAGSGPALVMRGGDAAWPPARIVAGCDGSRESLDAARIAATIGRCIGAPLTILHVVTGGSECDIELRDTVFGNTFEARHARVEGWARRLATPDGPPVLASLTIGDPAAALLGAAGHGTPALLAVGRRGIGRIRHALLGSVSTQVLHHAAGPVLVAPASRAGTTT